MMRDGDCHAALTAENIAAETSKEAGRFNSVEAG